jgi:hypothetical protein
MSLAAHEVIRFPQWAEALEQAGFSPAERSRIFECIVGFLRFCKVQRAPVSIANIRLYLANLSAGTAIYEQLNLKP